MSDANTFIITEGDLEPPIGGTIYRAATEDELLVAPTVLRYPLDLTSALTVALILKPIGSGGPGSRRLTCAFVDRVGGKWRHAWVAGETSSPYVGSARGRIEIGWPLTRPQTAPTALEDAFLVTIQPDDG